jgi:Uma2 family endonuclease
MVTSMPISDMPLAQINTSTYHAMVSAGIFSEDDKIELINGYLIKKMSVGSKHTSVVKLLNRLLMLQLNDRAIIGIQDPVTLTEFSEPEPDISVMRFQADCYATSHPTPKDILLLIEVADTSLAFDRNAKIPLYAAADVPEAWLVDLLANEITVFRKPEGAVYRESEVFKSGQSIPLPGFAGASIAVSDLGL